MKTLHLILIPACMLLALVLLTTMGVSQTTPPSDATMSGKVKPAPTKPAPAEAEATVDEDRLKIEHADTLDYDPNTKLYHVRGNVVFANKNVHLYCDQADYNAETDSAKATGHLRITDPNSVITGDLAEADLTKKLGVITGNVQIVTQKQPSKPAATAGAPASGTEAAKSNQEPQHVEDYWEKPTTITCERVEYYYAADVKKMVATPRVKAVQEERTVWADTATFEDLKRLITLVGNVVLKTDKGDEMHCTKAVISVDEDWIKAENLSGITLRKSKNEQPQPTPKPAGEGNQATPVPAPEAPSTVPPAANGAGG